MIVKKSNLKKSLIEKPRGGEGTMFCKSYLSNQELTNKMTGFNLMELQADSEIGFHKHENDEEIYYIISGTGLVKDNENQEEVSAGDLIYTKDGEWHGLKNIGTEPLSFIAFIVAK